MKTENQCKVASYAYPNLLGIMSPRESGLALCPTLKV